MGTVSLLDCYKLAPEVSVNTGGDFAAVAQTLDLYIAASDTVAPETHQRTSKTLAWGNFCVIRDGSRPAVGVSGKSLRILAAVALCLILEITLALHHTSR